MKRLLAALTMMAGTFLGVGLTQIPQASASAITCNGGYYYEGTPQYWSAEARGWFCPFNSTSYGLEGANTTFSLAGLIMPSIELNYGGTEINSLRIDWAYDQAQVEVGVILQASGYQWFWADESPGGTYYFHSLGYTYADGSVHSLGIGTCGNGGDYCAYIDGTVYGYSTILQGSHQFFDAYNTGLTIYDGDNSPFFQTSSADNAYQETWYSSCIYYNGYQTTPSLSFFNDDGSHLESVSSNGPGIAYTKDNTP